MSASHLYLLDSGHLKAGPYAVCDNVATVYTGSWVYLWCYTVNGYGNRWDYVRI